MCQKATIGVKGLRPRYLPSVLCSGERSNLGKRVKKAQESRLCGCFADVKPMMTGAVREMLETVSGCESICERSCMAVTTARVVRATA